MLQQHTDEWHVGEQSIDLRMSRRVFAAVQKYVPECHVLIADVEAHVQMAEAQMFPARVQEEEQWAQAVLEDLLKTKVTGLPMDLYDQYSGHTKWHFKQPLVSHPQTLSCVTVYSI